MILSSWQILSNSSLNSLGCSPAKSGVYALSCKLKPIHKGPEGSNASADHSHSPFILSPTETTQHDYTYLCSSFLLLCFNSTGNTKSTRTNEWGMLTSLSSSSLSNSQDSGSGKLLRAKTIYLTPRMSPSVPSTGASAQLD